MGDDKKRVAIKATLFFILIRGKNKIYIIDKNNENSYMIKS